MGSGEEPRITVGEGVRPAAVIIGFGRVGRLVADMLRVHNQPFVAVESDIDTVAQARRDGYPIIFGDVSNTELIDKLQLGHAKALILTMDDPLLSARRTKRVTGWFRDLTIIARARDTAHAATNRSEAHRVGNECGRTCKTR